MIPPLETTPAGIVLAVKAKAGARSNSLQGVHDGALKMAVTQAPERGKANRALLELLAEHLEVRKSQISLLSGETSPQKRFLFVGITAEELSLRLTKALENQ